MPDSSTAPALDRPWRRPGAARYALGRLRGAIRPPVTVYAPAPGALVFDHDVAVPSRDGTVPRVNVHRPSGAGPFPVLLCAHPYGKDTTPRKRRRGGYTLPFQFRALRQPCAFRLSMYTGWEAPDPAWWTGQDYAVVNCDLRGAGTSQGTGSLLSRQAGEDTYDLIEWAGAQPWSTGAVGMLGVSYLAISQWRAAALQPPSVKAIVPWEGFTDAYRGLLFPGGFREVGFVKLWERGLHKNRLVYRLGAQSVQHPRYDDFYRSLVPDLSQVTVPALVCGSFSDNNLHGRDRVTTGWLRASLRELDPDQSRPYLPVPTFTTPQPLKPGEIVPLDIPLGPSATLFRGGETLRLVVSGRWLWPRNPLFGNFPAAYQAGPKAKCTLHWGPEHAARLLVPIITAG